MFTKIIRIHSGASWETAKGEEQTNSYCHWFNGNSSLTCKRVWRKRRRRLSMGGGLLCIESKLNLVKRISFLFLFPLAPTRATRHSNSASELQPFPNLMMFLSLKILLAVTVQEFLRWRFMQLKCTFHWYSCQVVVEVVVVAKRWWIRKKKNLVKQVANYDSGTFISIRQCVGQRF